MSVIIATLFLLSPAEDRPSPKTAVAVEVGKNIRAWKEIRLQAIVPPNVRVAQPPAFSLTPKNPTQEVSPLWQYNVTLIPTSGEPIPLATWDASDGKRKVFVIDELVGVFRWRGDGQPRASKIVLTPERDPGPEDKKHRAVQTASDYRTDMLVAPGFYDLWLIPANGTRAVRIAERIRVHPGKVTEID